MLLVHLCENLRLVHIVCMKLERKVQTPKSAAHYFGCTYMRKRRGVQNTTQARPKLKKEEKAGLRRKIYAQHC